MAPMRSAVLAIVAMWCGLASVDALRPSSPFAAGRKLSTPLAKKRSAASGASSTFALSAFPAVGSTLLSVVAVAGVVAFHEAGHFLAAKSQGIKVQSFNVGYGPKLLAFNDSSSTEFALRLVPLGGYVAFPSNVELNDEGDIIGELSDPDLLQNRPPLQRALVISAGVIANILLTFLLASGTALFAGIGQPVYSNGVVVTTTLDPAVSSGYSAGIRVNDVITKLGDVELIGSERTVNQFISIIRSNPEKPVNVEIIRDNKPLQLTVTPRAATPGGSGAIGVGINARIDRVETHKASNVLEAAELGADETARLVSFTWNAFSQSFKSGFQGGEVGGPISVVKAGAQMAETSPKALLGFAATLSVNLAVLNSLPFPALDGGQLAFVLIELLAGRPVPRKAKDAITALAFSFLLALGASTLLGDIARVNDPLPPIVRGPPSSPK